MSDVDKVDLKRELPSYRARRGRVDVVDVAPAQYLMVDGAGDPNTAQEYADALAALYPVAYRLKFASKQQLGRDHAVMPLEGLWWAPDLAAFTSARDKTAWRWTAMIMVPPWISRDLHDDVVTRLGRKDPPTRLADVRLETFDEGRCVQTLHVGPYDAEGPVLHQMHEEFIPDHGLTMTGRHHEVYLNDARRTDPARLRTILRQPVA
ncbi:GyrI-like domain-containing protein [Angustibacter peucedani]